MSWDVLFQDFPEGVTTVEDIPPDFKPEGLCTREYYEKMVFTLFPGINENGNRSWMILDGDSFSIEFNAGTDDPLESLMLHVRGDENALTAIKAICDYTGWKALDLSAGDFIDFEGNPDAGFSKWREYRDSVMTRVENKAGKRWWQFWK